MKLLRVSVPNFRNLKNVELTFEPSLRPAVFPIGSENGGGKSTLLQLIFVLLSCSLNDEKINFLKNFLTAIKEDTLIAKIDIIYKDQKIDISFDYITDENNDYQKLFLLFKQLSECKNAWLDLAQQKIFMASETRKIEQLKKEIKQIKSSIFDFKKNTKIIDISILENSKKFLICKTNVDDLEVAQEALKYAINHVYLVTPPTQTFLFLDKDIKKMMDSDFGKYQIEIGKIREKLSNIYIYNQLSITEIIHAFKQAKDQDWKTAINSNDLQYGTAFKKLVEDFHQFLGNDKYIFPSHDMTSIIVRRKTSDNEFIELEPEDLSHGELKRLGLYAWIKYNNINDSIILIDEIENGLHPDWQYNIVNELASWGDNQYLLATHSFYLCEALTPSHVKIIEPKLLNPTSEQ